MIRRRGSVFGSTKTWLAIVALIGILTAAWIGRNGDLKSNTVSYELFRFSLTVVLGGVIAFVFRMAETRRQIRDLRQRDLREFYRRCLDAYHEAKKVRRLLRARSYTVDEGVEIDRQSLDELMEKLQSAQLNFETLRRETETNPKLFSDEKAVEKLLKKVESYLRKVLKVHEQLGRVDPVLLKFEASERLPLLCFFYDAEILGKRGVPLPACDSFDLEFSSHVQEVRRLIVGVSQARAGED